MHLNKDANVLDKIVMQLLLGFWHLLFGEAHIFLLRRNLLHVEELACKLNC